MGVRKSGASFRTSGLAPSKLSALPSEGVPGWEPACRWASSAADAIANSPAGARQVLTLR